MDPTIAETAGLCFNAFQQCLEKSAFISPREMSQVEDQFARFSLWTANIGVFASGRASLDHRLRDAQEVHEVITGLLEMLDDKIKDCISYLKSLAEPEVDAAQVLDQEKLDKHIQGLASQITLLHRLSNTIRKASSETQNAKAANTFKILDDEGNNVEPLLEIVFANYVRDKFRSIDEKILQRLVRAMITRRKRVLYKRSRFGNFALSVKETKPRPKVQAPQIKPQQTPAIQELPKAKDKEDIAEANHKSQAGVSATTLAVDKFKKASAPSVISGTKTVAFDNHENLPFPVPPLGRVRRKYKKMKGALEEQHKTETASMLEEFQSTGFDKADIHAEVKYKLSRELSECWDQCLRAVGEVTCPFCFYAIPALDLSDGAKWRSHVRNDLDAYICLFEQCNDEERLFGHSEEWLRHMREHALRWPCNSKSHGTIVFDSRDTYINHLKEAHKNTFSDAQLRVLADRNARTIGPLFRSCPFCGFDDTSSGTKIEEHIVGHLRFLALKSLPPYEDERSESSDAETTSSKISKPRKRSTIENDLDKKIKPVFEDNGPILIVDPSDEAASESDTSDKAPERDQRKNEWGFVTEIYDRNISPHDDTVLRHLAIKHVRPQLSEQPTLTTEDIMSVRVGLAPQAQNMSDEQLREVLLKNKYKMLQQYPQATESPLQKQNQAQPETQVDSTGHSRVPDGQATTSEEILMSVEVNDGETEAQTEESTKDDERLAAALARRSSMNGMPPTQRQVANVELLPDWTIVPGTNQDENLSGKGKHKMTEVSTELSSTINFSNVPGVGLATQPRSRDNPSCDLSSLKETAPENQFLDIPGIGPAIQPRRRSDTSPPPSEPRWILRDDWRLPKDIWPMRNQGEDNEYEEDYISIKPTEQDMKTESHPVRRRGLYAITPEETNNEPSLGIHNSSVAAIESERRRETSSPGTRPTEIRSSRNERHDDKVMERKEVDNISETPVTGKIPDAVPRQGMTGSSILVNVDVSSQQPQLPNLDDGVLDDMINRLLASPWASSRTLCIRNEEITTLCAVSRELFLSQPALLELKAPVKIVGDIHGQYTDLLRMFELSGYPANGNYLFLGDYVDRGKSGLETILLLLCYKLKYPNNFFLLRGNHECANVTRVYGFYDECKRRCNIKMWKTFVDVFNCLPVAAVVEDKIFCVHGGLSPSLSNMNEIRGIARPTDIPDYGLLNDLLWSDPALMDEDWKANERGVSYTFGRNVIREFLTRFNFDLICRAHMVVEDGYEFYDDRMLVTIFTAPNYCGEFDNWGAIMSVADDLLCSFELLKPLSAEAGPLRAARSLAANLRDRLKKWTSPSGK